MILHGQTEKNASISLVTTAPLSRSCRSAGMSGCMPGVRNTTSACTLSRYPSPTWSVAPMRSKSRTSSSSCCLGVLSQASTVSPLRSSMRISGRFDTPMPSTAIRFPRSASKYAETFSFMVEASFPVVSSIISALEKNCNLFDIRARIRYNTSATGTDSRGVQPERLHHEESPGSTGQG